VLETFNLIVENVTIVRAFGRDLLCETDGAEFWIPAKVIDVESEISMPGETGILVIARWFFRQEGWA
jgi:hypothetical protein